MSFVEFSSWRHDSSGSILFQWIPKQNKRRSFSLSGIIQLLMVVKEQEADCESLFFACGLQEVFFRLFLFCFVFSWGPE